MGFYLCVGGQPGCSLLLYRYCKHVFLASTVRSIHVGIHGPVFVENDGDLSDYVHITNGAFQR